MSLNENSAWLEQAYENFDQACEDENWDLAEAIVADVKDNGFHTSSLSLKRVLEQFKKV